ncbi:MAG: protein translocase subunit SecD [Actinomycetota bacterium]|nr:protein translocase subunit SecD [Actinomycetota bacterium]
MRARLWTSLIGIVVVAVALLGYNLWEHNEPALGLDLQGGVSVVLQPTEDADTDELETVSDLVRDAVDSLGIAEPDVRVEGETIVVDLPGVEDQQEALDLVNVAGEVTLQPVFRCTGAAPDPTDPTTPPASTTPASTTPGSTAPGTDVPSSAAPAGWRAAATPDTEPPSTSDPAPPSTSPGGPPDTGGASTIPGSASVPPTLPAATTTTMPWFVTPTTAPSPSFPVDNGDGTFLLESRDGGFCQVGPSGGSGQVFSRKSASAVIASGAWSVEADLSGSGTTAWNSLAAQCYSAAPSCPSRQLAIVLDDVIQTAPTVNAPSFADVVSITGDFGEGEARDLAGVINRGAYPFDIEPATVQGVSASSGEESLRAVLIAGAVGIALVLAFMLIYYRALALVILAGLTLSGVILYGTVSLLSAERNLTLTIAGTAGIVVSVGVTVDSYVVFFERLKDEVRHGRTLRNSAARGFTAAWRTIVNANVAALIGALVLFWLSVGSVRGFAFFLALSTIIDLVVAWFFTRPAVLLLARSGRVGSHGVLGIDQRRPASSSKAATT